MGNLKLIIRGFYKKPSTSLINLLGLSVSLTLVIILSAYCYSELMVDKHHKNGDNIYRFSDRDDLPNNSSYMLKEAIDANKLDLAGSVRFEGARGEQLFQVGNNPPVYFQLAFSDKNFFDIFTYKPVEGSLSVALENPMSIVLTEKMARRLFGREPAIGQIVRLNNELELTVTSVIAESEFKTQFQFDALASFEVKKRTSDIIKFDSWNSYTLDTYVLLSAGSNPDYVARSIYSLLPKDFIDYGKERYGEHATPKLFPLSEINYNKDHRARVRNLLLLSILILGIALLNFVNISAFRWQDQLKQTGTLKVFGAGSYSILKNMLSEALLMFGLSFAIALLLVQIISPVIQNITGLTFNKSLIFGTKFLLIAAGSTFLMCVCISIVPSKRIAGSKAIYNLHKVVHRKEQNSSFKIIMVGVQFTVTIALIAFTLLVNKQIRFGLVSMGSGDETTLILPVTDQMKGKEGVLTDFFDSKPNIDKYSLTGYYPSSGSTSAWFQRLVGDVELPVVAFFGCDAQYFDIMNLELVQGRFFTDMASESDKIVVNQTLVKDIEDPIGKVLTGKLGSMQPLEIIGVVKDFHFMTLNLEIIPLVMRNDKDNWKSYFLLNLASNDFNTVQSTIKDIEKITTELSPNFPVEVKFLDQAIAEMYKSENQFRRTFSLFSFATIIICMLGLFAMSLNACQKRVREIGVRKINGAKVSEILTLLNIGFVRSVVIAFVIASPIAYYAMNKWLENFAYKTNMSWWIFALAGVLALGIALLTVSWQSWRAATRNPVEALRYE